MPNTFAIAHEIEDAIDHLGYFINIGEYADETRFHHVHNGLEIVIPHRGVARVFYGAWQASISPGQGCIGPGNVPHGASGIFDRTVIHFCSDLLSEKHSGFISFLGSEPKGHPFTFDGITAERLIWIANQLSHTVPGNDFPVMRDLMDLAITEIKSALNRPVPPRQRERQIINEITAYMQSQLVNDETLDAVADRFHMSRSHMSALFKEHFNRSPGEFWLQLRLQHACRLLAGDSSIREIALTVGFQSTSGFQRAFRRHYGMTPSSYRDHLESEPPKNAS